MRLLKYIKSKLDRSKWYLYMYYNGILIKKIKISGSEAPTEHSYIINVYFKKQLFKSNKVGLIVRPKVLLYNDDTNKKTYWGVVLEEGIKI